MTTLIFDFILIVALLAAYIYNYKTGKISEFETRLWNDFCGIVNSWIRKYEKRRATR